MTDFIALRDRAYAFLTSRGTPVTEDVLVSHVYGGGAPPGLRERLVAPLVGDPRFDRDADGRWQIVAVRSDSVAAYTALALATTGPAPERGRIVCVAALAVEQRTVAERFMAVVQPGKRVPGYVAERLGLDATVLSNLQPFESIVDALTRFLGARPIVAQDAAVTWSFVAAELRRAGRVVREPPLVDVNDLATRILDLDDKPTLARVAARLGISSVRIAQPEEEARVLVGVANALLERTPGALDVQVSAAGKRALQRAATAQVLPDSPGVYTMRDADDRAVYVGKARRLRSRVAAYVQRPLGTTRHLEGLAGAVERVERVDCDTDLEALVLEDREIRRLGPRFNTVRQSRAPRLWIRLPPTPGNRRSALRRLELATRSTDAAGEYVGPFRNEMLAEQARALARQVFDLGALRRDDPFAYEPRLLAAWRFLQGTSSEAEVLARQQSTRLLRSVLAFDVAASLLPADPRAARYAVVRSAPCGVEGFVLERGVCVAWRTCDDPMEAPDFAAALLAMRESRTTPDDVDVVLHWLGAQRPPARLICLPDADQAARDALSDAASALWEARAASSQDPFDAFADPVLGGGEVG